MPREVVAAQGTKLAQGPQLKLLYLFAGAARKSSVVEQLKSMCARKGISFHAEEVDTERCESHDLTNASLQKSLLEGIRSRKWHVAICTPPCSTFSRVRGANKNGPPPVRDAQHFWGLSVAFGPQISGGADRQRARALHLPDATDHCGLLQPHAGAG